MTKYQFLLKKNRKENWAFSSTISSSRSSTPNGWTSMPTIWSIRKKASGTCHWLSASVRAPSGMPIGLWKKRSLIILSAEKPYRTELSVAHLVVLYYNHRIFLIYTRHWSRKMHFFIRFREQGRATAHDFVVAHVPKKQYLCRRNWRSMTALLRNLYNCLNSSSPHRTQQVAR